MLATNGGDMAFTPPAPLSPMPPATPLLPGYYAYALAAMLLRCGASAMLYVIMRIIYARFQPRHGVDDYATPIDHVIF